MRYIDILKEGVNQRKHESQMSTKEKKNIKKRLKSNLKWEVNNHTLKRISEKNIGASIPKVISQIKDCKIIEYKIDKVKLGDESFYDERVLIRGNEIIIRGKDKYQLNVVFSLTTRSLVTVWLNHVEDTHKTLDWDLYNGNMIVPIANVQRLNGRK